MSNAELAEFLGKLTGLFPDAELTDAESGLWASRVRPFGLEHSVKAIEDHRIEARGKRRPDIGAFLGRLAVLVRVPGHYIKPDAFSAILRRQGVPGTTGADVICEHYRRLWMRISERNAVPVSEGYRAMLERQCCSALCAEDVQVGEAAIMARTIFEVVDVFA